ncbi:unnamed protein product [Urochloa decumbens]|uniref:WRKY domain-containing protein n=1 Tax=Urochloa decumbens TaxID=240449 RepID=A0ABC8Y8Z0_9POAL
MAADEASAPASAPAAAAAGGGEGARRPLRPTLSLPPRSAVESLFAAGSSSAGAGAGAAETSPGPLTLAAALFPDAPSPAFHGSFTQLLVGAIGSPAASAAAGAIPAPPSPFSVPPGLSPTAFLGSPGLFSPTGSFEMSHQQALAQVTAQAVHSQYIMINNSDYLIPFSPTTRPAGNVKLQHVNPVNVTSAQEISTLPSHTCNNKTEPSEVSKGLQNSAPAFDKPADDGYNWRKYGQKAVKGGEYPRSYYKCTHASCPVKKKVERSGEGHITQIIYRGQHNHQRPPKRRSKDGGGLLNEADDFHDNEYASTRSEPGSQDHSGKHGGSNDGMAGPSVSRRREEDEQSSGSSDSEEEADDERVGNGDAGRANANRRHVPTPAQRIIVQTTSEVDLLDDGYRWRKYGQKVVKGNPYPRSYYKCTYQGCDVKKHIERSSQDPKAVITTYEGKHSHDVPAARNSSHIAAANTNASSSTSLPHKGQKSVSSSRRRADVSSASSMLLKEENEIT